MGVMKVLLLLLLLIFNFSFPISFANNLVSGNSNEEMKNKQIDDSDDNSTSRDGNGIINQSKFAHAGSRGGGGGGHPVGEGNNGNGGQTTPSQQGGSGVAVIPVYAAAGAGAAGRRKSHNGAVGSYGRCWKGRLLTPIVIALILLISI